MFSVANFSWVNDGIVECEVWTPWVLVVLMGYFPTIFFLQWVMASRPALDLHLVQKTWNILMSVLSFVGFFTNLRYVYDVGFEKSYSTLEYSNGLTGLVVLMFNLSKIPELLDTVFIVLQKKQLIFLHWFHHFTVAVYCWFTVFRPPPTGYWFSLMNMFVHGIMYAYFAFACEARGLSWFHPVMITVLQITQMIAGLAITALHLTHEDTVFDGPTIANALYAIPMYSAYLYLFCRFFETRYIFETAIKWPMCAYFFIVHVAGLIGLWQCLVHESLWVLAEAVVWYMVSGWGITVGCHRLWSHRSFKARTPTRVLLMLLASVANQGDIYHWSRDHRSHHKCSDSAADPHDIQRGFFYAHVGWILMRKKDSVVTAGKQIPCDDLLADGVVRFHQSVNPWWNQFWCFVVPGLYGMWRLDSFMSGMFVFGAMRWVMSSHATWCVNSVAHLYGTRPYKDILPSQSFVVALLTNGEGWHNYHHSFPWDYATAEHNWWLQWNTSKMLIDFFAIFGQTYDHKRARSETVAKHARTSSHAL
jgi:stearoyl-CoA desaturase (delta-9 desaturase)